MIIQLVSQSEEFDTTDCVLYQWFSHLLYFV